MLILKTTLFNDLFILLKRKKKKKEKTALSHPLDFNGGEC